jgi:hypothetical protein
MRFITILLLFVTAALPAQSPNGTFANPLDLDYRFMPDTLSWRQAADPLVVRYRGEYWLFASKSGGYWHSPDFRRWTLVAPTGLPLEDYAPAVVEIGGRLYYTAHKSKALWTTDDPAAGAWRKVADIGEYADPDLFLDDDGRLFLYHGSSLGGGISAVELDPKHDFRVVAGPTLLTRADTAERGWERSGPDNLGARMTEGFRVLPYVEGSWMTKHRGTYYLQYAAPGTVWNTYADGVFTSRSPLGPFTYQAYSPFSYRPAGFIGGAGHSGMFQDFAGHWWRVTTMIVSVKHKFERRLGVFPAGFDADGVLRADTYLGDYPQRLPATAPGARDPLGTPGSNLAGWMLLSGGRAATASSTLDGRPASAATDENVTTWWSARTGDAGEWLTVDLGRAARIHAVQVNLGEQDTKARGRDSSTYSAWLLEASDDGRAWRPLVDRRASREDRAHVYAELAAPVTARYLRLTNAHASARGRFAVRDLRVFGLADVPLPHEVRGLAVRRDARDRRTATISWAPAAGAEGYVVRFGVAPDKLYASWQAGRDTTITTHGLNRDATYWFAVDALNGAGVTRGRVVHDDAAAGH